MKYNMSDHIKSLSNHGVKLITDNGFHDLSEEFYLAEVKRCKEAKCLAFMYDIDFPGIEEEFMLVIHRDGHVESGSKKNIEGRR